MQDCYFLLINKTVMKMALLASVTFGMLNDGDAGRGRTARTQRCSPEGSRWRTPWPWQSIACPRPTTTTTAGAWRPQRPTPLMNVRCLGANRLWYFFHCRHFFPLSPKLTALLVYFVWVCGLAAEFCSSQWWIPLVEFYSLSIPLPAALYSSLVQSVKQFLRKWTDEMERKVCVCAWIYIPPDCFPFHHPFIHVFTILNLESYIT